jgi:hypothetical protein
MEMKCFGSLQFAKDSSIDRSSNYQSPRGAWTAETLTMLVRMLHKGCVRRERPPKSSRAETLERKMKTSHYRAAYAESNKCITACPHEHQTVHQAAACILSADGYVVAVEDGLVRRLTDAEEVEFQFAMRGQRAELCKGRAVCEHVVRAVRNLVESANSPSADGGPGNPEGSPSTSK